jgi:ADP-ribose pyrophosphatase
MDDKKWQIIESEPLVDHPFLNVAMEKVSLPDGQVIPDWPIVHARDYVNVAAFNEKGDALILEGYKHGARRNGWQVVGGYLEEGESPLAAAQRELVEETGYASDNWRYLGSFIVDANRHVGTGHFFLAADARRVQEPAHNDLEEFSVHWVSLKELKYALVDGRINVISYAVNISLALITLEKLWHP